MEALLAEVHQIGFAVIVASEKRMEDLCSTQYSRCPESSTHGGVNQSFKLSSVVDIALDAFHAKMAEHQ